MNDKPDLKLGIYRIMLTMHCKRASGELYWASVVVDLIWQNDLPIAVLEWGGPQDKQYPYLTVKLDPELIVDGQVPEAVRTYNGHIKDPRTNH